VIYLDSCALVKLVAPEPESSALIDWLRLQSDQVVTSALAEVELPRALRRNAPRSLGLVSGMLTKVDRFEMDLPVRVTAWAYVEPQLRSLDAIHLATAQNLVASGKRISAFVTYDKRLAAAAVEAGLTVVAPGAA
jgi:predicted nucleic acid-binding protein